MSWIFQRFFSPLSVRHAPDSVCGMLRIRCATYPGFTVRHAPDYACPQGDAVYTDYRKSRGVENRNFPVRALYFFLLVKYSWALA
jgi:hypothetical protein